MKKILSLLLLFLFLACNQQEEITIQSSNFKLVKLADGVYACIHKFGGKAICNVGVIDNGTETIIFDSFLSPEVAQELLSVVEQLQLSPIKYVVNSHAHNDHIRGNQVFAKDVDILSTSKTAELIARWEEEEIPAEKVYAPRQFAYYDSLMQAYSGDPTDRAFQQILMWRPYYEVLSKSHEEVKTRLPKRFVDDRDSLDGPKRKVQLITLGGGHTESDLILYLPDDNIVFTGDLVFNGMHPYMAHGAPKNWEKWLRFMEGLKVKKIVPGHGEVGNTALLTSMWNYIKTVEDIARTMHAKNIPAERAGEMPLHPSFKEWWFDRFFVSNIKFMHAQLSNSE